MSTQVPHPAKDKSIEKRMRRWVKNGRIEIAVRICKVCRHGSGWSVCVANSGRANDRSPPFHMMSELREAGGADNCLKTEAARCSEEST
jgi:hypothetical protein